MKKKILTFAMSLMLLVTAFAFAGCKDTPPEEPPVHTHEYVSDLYYEISDNIVYSYSKCSCNENGNKQEVANAIIVNPENVIETLSGDIDGKTIVFDKGTYSTEMRIPKAFNNVTFAGTQNAKITNWLYLIGNNTNYLKNLTFTRLNFEGKDGILYFSASNLIENITIQSCNFITTENNGKNAAINFGAVNTVNLNNVVLQNSTIDGHYQGIITHQVNHLTVKGNTFKNLTHNAIAVQSIGSTNYSTDYYATGDIKIQNNIIDEIQNRAIRFGVAIEANIEISGNQMSNIKAEDDGTIEVLKAQLLNNCTFNFNNNIYAGNKINSITSIPENSVEYVVSA